MRHIYKYTIEDLQKIAAGKGGDCLSLVYSGSKSLYQWRCAEGHEWAATAGPIMQRAVWCPKCSKAKAGKKLQLFRVRRRGSLTNHFPEIAKEWDTEKNAMPPEDISPMSNKKVWWRCPRGHPYQTTVASRTRMASGCPQCTSKTSKFELCLFAELKSLFAEVEWRSKKFGMECDVYVVSINLGIELDGGYWHADTLVRDIAKTNRLASAGLRLLRVRDQRLPEINGDVVLYNNTEQPLEVTRRVVAWINEHFSTVGLGDYLSSNLQLGKKLYQAMLANLPGPPPGQTLTDTHPAVALEWNVEANAPLVPSMFSYGSNFRAFWVCSHGHQWRAAIYSRTQLKAGCPKCGQRKSVRGRRNTLLVNGRTFAARHPELIKEWAYDKNGEANPTLIMAGNKKDRYWWRCERGHEWQATCGARHAGYGCQACYRETQGTRRRQADLKRRGTNLAILYPHLVNEWDYGKNTLTLEQVLSKSIYRAHWKCSKGHEWQSPITSRTAGSGCPICFKEKRSDIAIKRAISKSGSLADVLATLDFELLDIEYADCLTPVSKQTLKWQCRVGHVFSRAVYLVVNRLPCPICKKTSQAEVRVN